MATKGKKSGKRKAKPRTKAPNRVPVSQLVRPAGLRFDQTPGFGQWTPYVQRLTYEPQPSAIQEKVVERQIQPTLKRAQMVSSAVGLAAVDPNRPNAANSMIHDIVESSIDQIMGSDAFQTRVPEGKTFNSRLTGKQYQSVYGLLGHRDSTTRVTNWILNNMFT